MFTGGLQWVSKRAILVLQVDALYNERRRKLQELQNELNQLAGITTDTHLRGEVDAYLAWIGTTGQTATLREIIGVKGKIIQLERPLFCYRLHFFIKQSSIFRY